MKFIFAYVDPGTGATLTQLLLAGSVGIAAVVKLKWQSIRKLVSRGQVVVDDADQEVDADEDSTLGSS